MEKTFNYRSDNYDRQKQRFIIPLYIKDVLGTYNYSSTGTFLRYNGMNHYLVFAAHALNNNLSIEDIFIFNNEGKLEQIIKDSVGHRIFVEDDIVIVDYFNIAFNGKNYFNLNINDLVGFDKNHFGWIGFPISKTKSVAKVIHNTKSSETLKKDLIHIDEKGVYFKKMEYFSIETRLMPSNKNTIQGKYNRDNINLKYAGNRSKGPHPEGMSGGAMYFFTKNQKLKDTLDDTFRFAGIGLEYKDNIIKGISKYRIIELLDIFNEENPLQFNLNI
ncbi:hypothetical protein NG764_00140 [Aliarcobacter cryaerophilus]|uniref:hypothetical protein n=1 Tax=Aliarcobacter cryaerophilus TaxID=28198 RepID=UPI003DA2F162